LYWPKEPERTYEPASFPEIVSDFANLNEGDGGAVEAFARRWGHLGYSALLPQAERNPTNEAVPEPLQWVWAHARGVRVCLDLLTYVRRGDSKRLDALLRSLQGPSARLLQEEAEAWPKNPGEASALDGDNWPWLLCGVLHEIQPWSWRSGQKLGPQLLAQGIIANIVSANLRGLSLDLHLLPRDAAEQAIKQRRRRKGETREYFLGFTFAPLILVIYWHVGRLAQQNASLGICEYCGKVFVRTDPRRRYCPVPAGLRGRESFCGRNARAHRDRAAAETGGQQSQKGKADV
jgi:hypothetical protein